MHFLKVELILTLAGVYLVCVDDRTFMQSTALLNIVFLCKHVIDRFDHCACVSRMTHHSIKKSST